MVLLFTAMMLLAVGQIVLREVFDSGIQSSEQVIKLIVFWLALVSAIAASRDDRHIRIDALSHGLSDRAAGIVRIIVDLFAASVCAVLAWYTYQYLKVEIEYPEMVLGVIPNWAAHIIVPITFLLVSYRFLVLIVLRIYEVARGEPLFEDGEEK